MQYKPPPIPAPYRRILPMSEGKNFKCDFIALSDQINNFEAALLYHIKHDCAGNLSGLEEQAFTANQRIILQEIDNLRNRDASYNLESFFQEEEIQIYKNANKLIRDEWESKIRNDVVKLDKYKIKLFLFIVCLAIFTGIFYSILWAFLGGVLSLIACELTFQFKLSSKITDCISPVFYEAFDDEPSKTRMFRDNLAKKYLSDAFYEDLRKGKK